MTDIDQLEHRIDGLLRKVQRDRINIADNAIQAERLSETLNTHKRQGRDAVFELMLRSSHRRFMRFLARHAERAPA